jgi:cellulose biosynthesis protein BcsQ
VGKSTVAQNLAHALALTGGKQVLVIDVDHQCNTTGIFCGPGAIEKMTLYDVLQGADPSRCIYPTPYDNVFCLPNIPKTGILEPSLYLNIQENYFLMRKALRNYVKENYDFILVDCPPNIGIMVYNAMVMSDAIIVPVECGSRYSMEGLESALDLIKAVQTKTNPDLFFLRLLINKVDMRSSAAKMAVGQTVNTFGVDSVFNTTIPQNNDFKNAEGAYKTVLRHAPQSSGAKRFRTLCSEFLSVVAEDQENASQTQMQL